MTTKEYLSQIKKINRRLECLARDRIFLIRQAESAKAIRYDKVNIKTTGASDPISSVFEKIETKEEKIIALIDELIDLREDVARRIEGLEDDRHVYVLRLRYIDLLTWEKIADQAGYSLDWTLHLHGDAIRAFYAKWGAELNLSDNSTVNRK